MLRGDDDPRLRLAVLQQGDLNIARRFGQGDIDIRVKR